MKLDREAINQMRALSNLVYAITKHYASLGAQIEKTLDSLIPTNQLDLMEEAAKLQPIPIKYQFIDTMKGIDNFPCIPSKGSEHAAAYDLRAYIPGDSTDSPNGKVIILNHGDTKIIRTNLRVEVPIGYELNVYTRSGMATKGIIVANAPGIIDADYRGEVCVILHNQSNKPYHVIHADRIAQCSLKKVEPTTWIESDQLTSTERGEGGFGSTGVK